MFNQKESRLFFWAALAILVTILLLVSHLHALAVDPPKYTCAEIKRYSAIFGIDFVIREAKKRGADDATIQKMRKQCGV